MHRRARHLNPGSAGAVLALDSRYITGLSDGGAVASWVDRSGFGNNLAQGTSGKQPIYKIGTINGNASVRFDGINDELTAAVAADVNKFTVITVMTKLSGDASNYRIGFSWGTGSSSTLWHGWFITTGFVTASMSNPLNDIFSNVTSPGPHISSSIVTGPSSRSLTFYLDGSFVGSDTDAFSSRTSNTVVLGNFSTGSFFLNTDMACVMAFGNNLTNPLRRRLEHAACYSFKIPCS